MSGHVPIESKYENRTVAVDIHAFRDAGAGSQRVKKGGKEAW
jgi:hypothetical protein